MSIFDQADGGGAVDPALIGPAIDAMKEAGEAELAAEAVRLGLTPEEGARLAAIANAIGRSTYAAVALAMPDAARRFAAARFVFRVIQGTVDLAERVDTMGQAAVGYVQGRAARERAAREGGPRG